MQVYWIGNGQSVAQVVTITVTAVPGGGGGVLTATINGKTISYTTVSADTTSTAASAWQALLNNTAVTPPEFQEISWSVATNVVTGTAQVAGTPFTATFSATGGATLTSTTTTPNSSPSDVLNTANWNRVGAVPTTQLPQNGDDVIVANSNVPLLWNLNGLAAVQFNSFTRWQSFTGTIGLPENNPLGYFEYRPTYFQFSGTPGGLLNVTLGQGATGSGPGRERYNVGQQNTLLNVLGSGGALDDFSVRFLGGNGSNTLRIVGASVGVAVLPGEQAALSQATVDGGGSLTLGPGVLYGQSVASGSSSAGPSSSLTPTQGGLVTAIGSTLTLFSAPGTVILRGGASGTVLASNVNFPNVQVLGGSNLVWTSNATIGALVLTAGSSLNKSQDVQPMSVGTLTIDADTCQVLDPNNAIAWTGQITLNNALQFGPFQLGTGRKLTIV